MAVQAATSWASAVAAPAAELPFVVRWTNDRRDATVRCAKNSKEMIREAAGANRWPRRRRCDPEIPEMASCYEINALSFSLSLSEGMCFRLRMIAASVFTELDALPSFSMASSFDLSAAATVCFTSIKA